MLTAWRTGCPYGLDSLTIMYFRVCYFRTAKALSGGSTPFLEDLNKTFGSGVLTCDFEAQENALYLAECC